MQKLTENIINIFGDKGKMWLDNLPNTVATLSTYWRLTELKPVDNMTFNYVVKAMRDQQPMVLKISCDVKSIMDEKQALQYFNGVAAVKLMDFHKTNHALLLEQAVPGITLKSLYPIQMEAVMDCYIATMKALHNKSLPVKHPYRHISDWLKAIDKPILEPIPKALLAKAIHLKSELLASMKQEILLHGDLHHDNIIKNGKSWLIIDPKGIVGDAEFEIAAFDFFHSEELKDQSNIKRLFEERLNLLANKSGLNAQRIKDWTFVRLILMAAWQIEDKGDPGWAINLASLLN